VYFGSEWQRRSFRPSSGRALSRPTTSSSRNLPITTLVRVSSGVRWLWTVIFHPSTYPRWNTRTGPGGVQKALRAIHGRLTNLSVDSEVVSETFIRSRFMESFPSPPTREPKLQGERISTPSWDITVPESKSLLDTKLLTASTNTPIRERFMQFFPSPPTLEPTSPTLQRKSRQCEVFRAQQTPQTTTFLCPKRLSIGRGPVGEE
jgi:hypothetical protein